MAEDVQLNGSTLVGELRIVGLMKGGEFVG
jgi:hypothetical protein